MDASTIASAVRKRYPDVHFEGLNPIKFTVDEQLFEIDRIDQNELEIKTYYGNVKVGNNEKLLFDILDTIIG